MRHACLRQSGIAAVVLLLFLLLGSVTFLIERLRPAALQSRRAASSDAALALAKEALLGYAVTYGDTHAHTLSGYLPCPDTTGKRGVNVHEGSPDPPCADKDVSLIGRLPWHILGLEPLRDGSGECLWYAVSGNFKNDPDTDMLNWDTPGQLAVLGADSVSLLAGRTPEDRAAAVIFAPGAALPGQRRDTLASAAACGGNYAASNYLEAAAPADNSQAAVRAQALSLFASAAGNDRLIVLSASEIYQRVHSRADFRSQIDQRLAHLAACVAAYGQRNSAGAADRRLPWAAPLLLSDYVADAAYADETGRSAGRLPSRVTRSKPSTGNAMPGTQLFDAAVCAWSAQDALWYRHWKDQLFYAVAADHAAGTSHRGACATCLSVNGGGHYAAVILFAGPRLPGQARASNAAKATAANYLEDRNAAAIASPTGRDDFLSAATTPRSNDILYCIDTALAAAPCA